jgi:hypothetical protein
MAIDSIVSRIPACVNQPSDCPPVREEVEVFFGPDESPVGPKAVAVDTGVLFFRFDITNLQDPAIESEQLQRLTQFF